MGGNVFAPALLTPRMPPAVYDNVKQKIIATLQKHFKHVAVPLEAPAKSDYGDIDVLVAEPLVLSHSLIASGKQLASILNAHTSQRTADTMHLALPWPKDTSLRESTIINTDASTTSDLPMHNLSLDSSNQKYIQLDLRVLRDHQTLEFLAFHHAHGDLWNMIGSTIRRYGLTCTDEGLYIRIHELEHWNKGLSRVLVSRDPTQILSFLGLDVDQYQTQFRSWDEMMSYAASCRFHDPARVYERKNIEQEACDDNEKEEVEPPKLKANDRQRTAKRPLFAYYITTFLPSHQHDPPGRSVNLSREEAIIDAKSFFGPDFTSRFDDQRRTANTKMMTAKFWADLRKSVVPFTPLMYSMTTVSGEVREEDISMRVVMKAVMRHYSEAEEYSKHELQKSSGGNGGDDAVGSVKLDEGQTAWVEGRYDDAKTWAEAHWKDLAVKLWEEDKEKNKVRMVETREKEKLDVNQKQTLS